MIPVFVISIPGSARRTAMQGRMDKVGLTFEWWDAIDGRDKDPREILGADGTPVYSEIRTRLALDGRAMNGGEVAVCETTFRLYRHCLEMGFHYVAILEDDAWPQPHLPAVLADIESLERKEIVRLFYPLSSVWNRWHGILQTIIRSYRRVFHKSGTQTPDEKPILHRPEYTISDSAIRLKGAAGYTITADAMRKVLRHVYPVRLPIDLYFQYREIHGVHSLCVQPPCVIVKQDEIPSEIGYDKSKHALRCRPQLRPPEDSGQLSRRWNLSYRYGLPISWWLGRYVLPRFRRIYQLCYDVVRVRRYL